MNRIPNSKKCDFVFPDKERIMLHISVVVVKVLSKILENGKIILYVVLTTGFSSLLTKNVFYILK
jgi:hypothetical protein